MYFKFFAHDIVNIGSSGYKVKIVLAANVGVNKSIRIVGKKFGCLGVGQTNSCEWYALVNKLVNKEVGYRI